MKSEHDSDEQADAPVSRPSVKSKTIALDQHIAADWHGAESERFIFEDTDF